MSYCHRNGVNPTMACKLDTCSLMVVSYETCVDLRCVYCLLGVIPFYNGVKMRQLTLGWYSGETKNGYKIVLVCISVTKKLKNSKNDDTNTNLFTHMTDKNTIRKMC